MNNKIDNSLCSAQQVKSKPTILSSLEEQKEVISKLHDIVSQLDTKLTPSKQQEPEDCEKDCRPPFQNTVKGAIDEHTELLHKASSRLNKIINTVEL